MNSKDGPSSDIQRLLWNFSGFERDPDVRHGWAARGLLLCAAVTLLLWSWMARSQQGFRVGAVASRNYVALYSMRFLDQEATAVMKERVAGEIEAVLMKDRELIETLEQEFRMLADPGGMELLPPSLAELLQDFPPARRQRLLEVAGDLGLQILREDRPAFENGEAHLWDVLEASGMEWSDRNVVFQILDSLIEPTLRIDTEATRQFREHRKGMVPPVERFLRAGDTIVARGEKITPQIGMLLDQQGYPRAGFPARHVIFVLLAVFLWSFWPTFLMDRRGLRPGVMGWLYFATLVSVGWGIQVISYHLGIDGLGVLPMAGWAYLTVSSSSAFPLVLGAGALGVLIAMGSVTTEIALMLLVVIVVAVCCHFLFRDIKSRLQLWHRFFIAGLVASAVSFVGRWWIGLTVNLELAGFFILSSAVLGMVAVAFLPLWENLFDVMSPLRLLELSHPSSPLLKRLQIEAPGTYHHSLMVGTLAEAAADSLGMNSLLVKAGAYYHDIGKLRRPQFYVENQLQGENVHDDMAPTLSALVIISHVREGMELAAEYKLPARIRDFIAEHHGTTCLGYFYRKARSQGENIPQDQFCYPGPAPRSPETALLMLADSTEAAVRAAGAGITSFKDLQETVSEVVESKLSGLQLEQVDLTLRDLTVIKEVFVRVLRSMYHTRQIKKIDETVQELSRQEG